MSYKMKGFGGFGNSQTIDPPTERKPLFDSFTRTSRRIEGDQKYIAKKKRGKKVKQAIKWVGKGFKNYGEQVAGKRKPKNWCPKPGPCGFGPKNPKPSLFRRLMPW